MTASPGPGPQVVDLGPRVRAAFTTAAANLGLRVGDDRAAVLAGRRALERWAGVPVVYALQVHGAHVHTVTGPHGAAGSADRPGTDTAGTPGAAEAAELAVATADGMVTDSPDVALAVLVADCVPVLLADPAAGVVGTAHAGRRGVVAGVVPAVVARMVGLGARPERLRAVIGPAACGGCYEVPVDLRAEVDAAVPGSAASTTWGTPSLDLPGAVAAQLDRAGVVDVRSIGGCTLEDPRWFSHRASTGGSGPHGATALRRAPGRMAGVVRLLPERVGVSPGRVGPAGLA